MYIHIYIYLYIYLYIYIYIFFDFLVCWQKLAQNDKKLCVTLYISGTIHHMIVICHTPHLRKNTSYDHDFWYTCVK